jgi:hypothetical protein
VIGQQEPDPGRDRQDAERDDRDHHHAAITLNADCFSTSPMISAMIAQGTPTSEVSTMQRAASHRTKAAPSSKTTRARVLSWPATLVDGVSPSIQEA